MRALEARLLGEAPPLASRPAAIGAVEPLRATIRAGPPDGIGPCSAVRRVA